MNSYPVYYVNLDRCQDRQVYLHNQFEKHGITNYHRVSAIDYKNITGLDHGDLTDNTVSHYINQCDGFSPRQDVVENMTRRAELACALSHFKAIIEAYKNNEQTIIVVEDDICLDLLSEWKGNLSVMINQITIPWYNIQLCCTNGITMRSIAYGMYNKDTDLPKDLCRCDDIVNRSGTVAYMVSREGMKYIYDNYYSPSNECVVLKGKVCASDHILYSMPYSYLSKIPLFYTLDQQFASCISGVNNPVGLYHQRTVRQYFAHYKGANPP